MQVRIPLPPEVAVNAGLEPATDVVQISRAHLEALRPGSDDFGDDPVEIFTVPSGSAFLAYRPGKKVWELLCYEGPGPEHRNYWSQVS